MIFLLLLSTGLFYVSLRKSLPSLEGEYAVAGLNAEVTIERDVYGIPTLQSASRQDIALGLGFLHAQERFFQMDLLRRNAAGELSALFGSVALKHDQTVRVHDFRRRAQAALKAMPADHAALLRAYTQGVNQGLEMLASRPFEYWLLRKTPLPWRVEDSFLCLYSMYLDLQHEDAGYERSLDFMKARLPADWYAFLKPRGVHLGAGGIDSWEAPLAGAYEQRLRLPQTPITELAHPATFVASAFGDHNTIALGSNSWGVSGRLSATGAAIVANDMHLGVRVPNIWYRASWWVPANGLRITGVTLPGSPVMVMGSNGRVAWGYTNSNGDWSDVIRLRLNAEEDEYLTPGGWESLRIREHKIAVGTDVHVHRSFNTRWGPVIGRDHEGNMLTMRWVAHDTEGANMNLLRMENVHTVEEGLALAATAGIPHQNLIIGERGGRLAWSIAGRIPRRGGDSPIIADWSQREDNWRGYLTPREYPVIYAHGQERLWSANARMAANALFDVIGEGSYDIGIRAGSIRDQLFARQAFDEHSMLDIQLSTHNRLLEKWKPVMDEAIASLPREKSLRIRKVLSEWDARADTHSRAYPLVRAFHRQVMETLLGPIYQTLTAEGYAGFNTNYVDNHLDNPLWLLVQERPPQALNPQFDSWPALLAASAETAFDKLLAENGGEDKQVLLGHLWGNP